MKIKYWRRQIFWQERRKKQITVTRSACICILLYSTVVYAGRGISSFLKTEDGQYYTSYEQEKKPVKKTEYGVHFEWKEGKIVFYRTEEEPYILKEAETASIH